jgi:peptidoglycan/LPS O-acetylase OafA/YrhL
LAEREDIPALTGLRGIAALVVVTYHARIFTASSAAYFPAPLLHGYLAVDLFFILSGFVIAHVYGARFASGVKGADYWDFLRARLARIYPLHLLGLLILLPLYGRGPDFQGRDLAFNVALLNGPWLDHQNWNHPSWSISGEWHAYLLFPIAAQFLLRWPIARSFALSAAAVLLITTATGGHDLLVQGPWVLLRVLPEFAIGVLAYRLWRTHRVPFNSDAGVAVLLLGAVALCFVDRTDWIVVLIVFPALVLMTADARGLARRALCGWPLSYLGRISYAVYAVHWPIMVYAVVWHGHLAGWVAALGLIGTSLLVAAPVSHFIEYPARNWLRGQSRVIKVA